MEDLMSATFAPNGLVPRYHPSGDVRTEATTIASGYATTIYMYSPVALNANGTITLATAGAANALLGTFMGCEYTDTVLGIRRVSPFWPASTTATDIVAYITRDPDILYEIQVNGSVAQADVGSGSNFTATGTSSQGLTVGVGNGNAATGISLACATVTTNATAGQLRIMGLTAGPDNAFGDSFTKVLVQIANHQFINPPAAAI
jgi:hypothetical protein